MNEQEIKQNFAKNLILLRKARKLTQAGLAEKINYSDKSVSKWERGDVLPDIVTFRMIADFFGVTVDELIGAQAPTRVTKTGSRMIITLISCIGVILCALMAERILATLDITENVWIAYIYALPIISIICTVLCAVWFSVTAREIAVSALVWTLGLSVYLSVLLFAGKSLWFIFVASAVLQFIVILWFALVRREIGFKALLSIAKGENK